MELIDLLSNWGLPIVFATVFTALLGVPVPAAPFLIAAGALAASGVPHPLAVVAVAFAGALTADLLWFQLGRRFGRRLLGGLCRLSLSPDNCVRQADTLFLRHGARLLMVAKLVPGVSMVAVPTSAALGVQGRRFLVYDSIGALLWIGLYVGLGLVFSRQIEGLLRGLGEAGRSGGAVILILVLAYAAWKWLRRRRLRRLYRAVRVSPAELQALLRAEPEALILDARSELARREDPRAFPQSLAIDNPSDAELRALDLGRRTLITFCTCPNEASAALLAHRLLRLGHHPVRVLTGGLDALDQLLSEDSEATLASTSSPAPTSSPASTSSPGAGLRPAEPGAV